jgi:hypothetical protein
MARPLTREEFIALGEIAKARQQLMLTMFAGTKLKFGLASRRSNSETLRSRGARVVSLAEACARTATISWKPSSVPGQRETAEDFIKACAVVDDIDNLVAAVTSETVSQLLRDVTSLMTVFSSGISAVQAGKAVAEDGFNLYKSTDYRTGFLPGDPVGAVDAVRQIIKRDLLRHSVDLVRYSAATGVKIACLFVDMGIATTHALRLANSLAHLGLELYALGVEIRTMRAGNRRLAHPNTLNLTVFQECPILGCYYLTCTSTSMVANFFVADIGLPGWMDRVETLKRKKMDPLLRIAAENIHRSHLQLEGLSSNKGTHMQKNFFARCRSRFIDWQLRRELRLENKISGHGA